MSGAAVPVLVALAESDCEASVGGLLGQPANSLSSLAFAIAGGWLLAHVRHDGGWRWAALGAAAVAAGIGSVVYHGPMPPIGQFLHDIGLVSMPLTVGAVEVGTRRAGCRACWRCWCRRCWSAGSCSGRPERRAP